MSRFHRLLCLPFGYKMLSKAARLQDLFTFTFAGHRTYLVIDH